MQFKDQSFRVIDNKKFRFLCTCFEKDTILAFKGCESEFCCHDRQILFVVKGKLHFSS